MEAHVTAVNALLNESRKSGIDDSDDSNDEVWNGIPDESLPEPIDYEAEYIDEDRYTTVTVEEVDVSKEGLVKVVEREDTENDGDSDNQNISSISEEPKTGINRKIWPKKIRKKKFRYESKAERVATRRKQKAVRRLKAGARRG